MTDDADTPGPASAGSEPEAGCYEIRVEGHLDERWSDWVGGMAFHRDADGSTLLRGELADQSALHGVLARLRDLGLPLLSVARVVGRCPGREVAE